MAAEGGGPAANLTDAAPAGAPRRGDGGPATVADRLLAEGYAFDFFQAVRVLQRINPTAKPVGRDGPAAEEAARFGALPSTSFPPSQIHEIRPPDAKCPVPAVTVTFMGLTGPTGVLPQHYTELIMRRVPRESRPGQRDPLRDWFDIFNHRAISFFYRAWEKYRFFLPYERGEFRRDEPDTFTRALLSLIGLGTPRLRRRLAIRPAAGAAEPARPLAQIDDLALLFHAGLLARRPRTAEGLAMVLRHYFGRAVEVRQFQGQWLLLEPDDQSRLGPPGSNNLLGINAVAGERVWELPSKVRVRLGPLDYEGFRSFLPDLRDAARRSGFFVLSHLVRFYLGPELDFELQLVLRREDVPETRLTAEPGAEPLLGWNTWIRGREFDRDADDATFQGFELYRTDAAPPLG